MPLRFDSEAELEAFIIENYEDFTIFKNCTLIKSQFDFGAYGRPDLVFRHELGCIVIVELKNEELNRGHITQVTTYYKGFQEYIKRHELDLWCKCILVTPESENPPDCCFTFSAMPNINWATFTIDPLMGMRFSLNTNWTRVEGAEREGEMHMLAHGLTSDWQAEQ